MFWIGQLLFCVGTFMSLTVILGWANAQPHAETVYMRDRSPFTYSCLNCAKRWLTTMYFFFFRAGCSAASCCAVFNFVAACSFLMASTNSKMLGWGLRTSLMNFEFRPSTLLLVRFWSSHTRSQCPLGSSHRLQVKFQQSSRWNSQLQMYVDRALAHER